MGLNGRLPYMLVYSCHIHEEKGHGPLGYHKATSPRMTQPQIVIHCQRHKPWVTPDLSEMSIPGSIVHVCYNRKDVYFKLLVWCMSHAKWILVLRRSNGTLYLQLSDFYRDPPRWQMCIINLWTSSPNGFILKRWHKMSLALWRCRQQATFLHSCLGINVTCIFCDKSFTEIPGHQPCFLAAACIFLFPPVLLKCHWLGWHHRWLSLLKQSANCRRRTSKDEVFCLRRESRLMCTLAGHALRNLLLGARDFWFECEPKVVEVDPSSNTTGRQRVSLQYTRWAYNHFNSTQLPPIGLANALATHWLL